MDEEELIKPVADDASHEESEYIASRQGESTACESNEQQEKCGRSNAESGERNRIENVGGVLHHDEVDSPDHRHHEQQDVSYAERWPRRRVTHCGRRV